MAKRPRITPAQRNCRILISSNRNGILVWPKLDGKRRILLGGDPNERALNLLQLQALVDIATCKPGAHKDFKQVLFYDGHKWADEGELVLLSQLSLREKAS